MRDLILQTSGDMNAYAVHQNVWKVMTPHIIPDSKFLFRKSGDFIKVRAEVSSAVGREVVVPDVGETVVFGILLNAAKSVGKRRLPVLKKESVIGMVSKSLSPAFDIVTIQGEFMPGIEFGKPGHTMKFCAFEAWGTATVTDKEKCHELMKDGIGHAKRFGFGLLELEVAS